MYTSVQISKERYGYDLLPVNTHIVTDKRGSRPSFVSRARREYGVRESDFRTGAIAAEEPPAPSTVRRNLSGKFDLVIERALAKDKDHRYQSAKEMVEELQALEWQATAANAPSRIGKNLWLAAAGIAVLAAGGFFCRSSSSGSLRTLRTGRRHIQEFTEQSFSQSVVDFQNAIRLDPDYAAAYAGLADAYLPSDCSAASARSINAAGGKERHAGPGEGS